MKRQFLDSSGNPLSSGKLTTYLAGTLTAATVYQTSSGTAHTNPIVLDSAGRISGSSEIYLEPGLSYKFALTTSADVAVWTQDNISAVPASTVNTEFQGTFGVAADPGDLMYLSDGSGSLTAGSWYKSDADLTYGSVTPELAFAVNATSALATGTLRQGGVVDLSGLTPGTKYYVSATAGGVTSTAPVNARYVGQAISTTTLVISHDIADSSTDGVAIDPRIKSICDGRLTLTTGTPVTTADVTAAGTLYWALYGGNQIGLYNGTRWQAFTVAQLSIAVPAAATQVYDAFVDYNSGTPALTLTAWTNDTTRATALVAQDGVLVLTGTLGKRYVGTVRTISASQLNDSAAFRHVWNYYHRVPRTLRISDATATWTYDGILRQARASTANQVDVVVGVAEVPVQLAINEVVTNSAGSMNVGVSIGEDSTSAAATGYTGGAQVITTAAEYALLSGYLYKYPAVGRHIYTWLELASAGTTTWHGAALSGGGAYGLAGTIEG